MPKPHSHNHRRFAPTGDTVCLEADIKYGSIRLVRQPLSERAMARLLAPTTEKIKPSPGIPADVLAARRTARKTLVKMGRNARRS